MDVKSSLRSKMSHMLVSGGSPHELYDSISPRMRLYFLNIGARLKNLRNHCFIVGTKFNYIHSVSPVEIFLTAKMSKKPLNRSRCGMQSLMRGAD